MWAAHRGISQSIDVFIIVAAVLAVGGIVTAAIYELGLSATSNTSFVIEKAVVHPVAGGNPTIVVKNVGSMLLATSASVSITGVTGQTYTGYGAIAPGAYEIVTVSSAGAGTLVAGNTVSVTVTQGSYSQTVTVQVSQS